MSPWLAVSVLCPMSFLPSSLPIASPTSHRLRQREARLQLGSISGEESQPRGQTHQLLVVWSDHLSSLSFRLLIGNMVIISVTILQGRSEEMFSITHLGHGLVPSRTPIYSPPLLSHEER